MRETTIRTDTTDRHLHKYRNRNPLHVLALTRFYDAVAAEIARIAPGSTLDFGCGEGFLYEKVAQRGVALPGYVGIDLRGEAIAFARRRHPEAEFREVDLFEWPEPGRTFDLTIAAEVLEHLPDPDPYLRRLVELTARNLLLTVPNEPWFRLVNLLRGRDIARLGNHPEHVQQWSPRTFAALVARHAVVERVYGVFPFVVLVARPR